MGKITQLQLGKNGLTDNFIETLKTHFKKCKNVRISVLKSCCRDREELKKIKNEILEKLGEKYRARVIGFVIVVRR
ncbi:MAG: YhbY family RNA-binding protein [archaeon]